MNSSQLDRWLSAARKGDNQAVEAICSILRQDLLPRIESRIPRSLDVEDVFADALVEILQVLRCIETGEELMSEAWRAVRRVAARWEREQRRTVRFDWTLVGTYSSDCIVNLEFEDFLQFIQERLTQNENRLFRLEYAQRLSPAKLAQRLWISSVALASRSHRLRLKLRRLVEKYRRSGRDLL